MKNLVWLLVEPMAICIKKFHNRSLFPSEIIWLNTQVLANEMKNNLSSILKEGEYTLMSWHMFIFVRLELNNVS